MLNPYTNRILSKGRYLYLNKPCKEITSSVILKVLLGNIRLVFHEVYCDPTCYIYFNEESYYKGQKFN